SEERLSAQHRKALESQLAEKQRERDAHSYTKPKEVQKPEENASAQEQSKATAGSLQAKQAELARLEKLLVDAREKDGGLAKKRSTAEKLLGRIQNFQRQFSALLGDC